MLQPLIRRPLRSGRLLSVPRKIFYHSRYPISQTTASIYTGGKLYQPIGLFLTGISLWSWKSSEKNNRKKKQDLLEERFLSNPPTFIAPYSDYSWFYKFYLLFSRCLYLTLLFTPVTCLFLLSSITGNETIYKLSLKTLDHTFCYSGCGVQKFVQWMSMRPDKFHPDLIDVAQKFKEDVPIHSFALTKEIFKDNFDKDLDDIFEWIDETPLASGTMAQVYRAKLREEYVSDPDMDREVAVKVRHRHVVNQSFTDPELLFKFCELTFALLAAILPFDRTEFSQSLRRQIDFRTEGYNMVKFKKNFDDDPEVIFPNVYLDLCSDEVLVESFCRGNPVSDMMSGFDQDVYGYHWKQEKNNYSQKYKSNLADKICELGVNMYLRDNFAHADLHSGNLMATEDGKLIVLDTGIVSNLSEESIEPFHELLEAGFYQNVDKFVDLLKHFNLSDMPVDEQGLSENIKHNMEIFNAEGVMNFGAFYGSVLHVLDRFDMELKGDVALSIVNMGVMEGMIRSLDAEYDLATRVVPFFVEKKRKQKKYFNLFPFTKKREQNLVSEGAVSC